MVSTNSKPWVSQNYCAAEVQEQLSRQYWFKDFQEAAVKASAETDVIYGSTTRESSVKFIHMAVSLPQEICCEVDSRMLQHTASTWMEVALLRKCNPKVKDERYPSHCLIKGQSHQGHAITSVTFYYLKKYKYDIAKILGIKEGWLVWGREYREVSLCS